MEIDGKAWALLQAIQQDARMSLTELAARVGLSVPATSERMKRLEEAGVIRAYRAHVDPVLVGYGVQALIGMTTPQPGKQKLLAKLGEMPEVIECLHVTGEDSYRLRVVAHDIAHLEALVGAINHFGETRTSIIMSTPIPLRPLAPPVR
ncbi:Lrp/AsnC family transcriptional regulator [Craterilacuibacter sinensis]|uniref:Winged helix-turn-helix transcriptional regulator n=1 Tax=Craterilacuibacter sinensis TaxID=2686017 RepID=A0A845BHY8_9NEIS|nr:Lrp/AsnC family transcriptional regulator [Craterilacuibacter sinensis]MXR35762.1 winged helix-turn-helix transcriptional regulator [Craterilacuibacter sinensis]